MVTVLSNMLATITFPLYILALLAACAIVMAGALVIVLYVLLQEHNG